MRTLHLFNVNVVNLQRSTVIYADVEDIKTGEYAGLMCISEPRFVEGYLEALRNNDEEMLERFTTLDNCEIVEYEIHGKFKHIQRGFVPYLQSDDDDQFYPLRKPESIPGFLRVVP